MGQQQLILLVLGIVIVGLAVVIGINAFNQKSMESDFDAITAEAMRIAGNALTWKATPRSLGGGKGASFLTGLSFDAMGYSSTSSNDRRSNSSRFIRSISALDTSIPYIVVRSQGNRDIRVQLLMYGPEEACFRIRRAIRTDEGWQEDNVDVSSAPTGCVGW